MGKIMYRGENFPGGPNLLSELRDVNFSNVQNKQIILYDSTSRTWKNHTITAADVAYDANNSVEDAIDSLNSALATKASLNDFNGANIPSRSSVTIPFEQGFLVVMRKHSNASLDLCTVFVKKFEQVVKIADAGSTTNVITVSSASTGVTITNNHSVAVYYYTIGK